MCIRTYVYVCVWSDKVAIYTYSFAFEALTVSLRYYLSEGYFNV